MSAYMLTLTTKDTPYRLSDLIAAEDSNENERFWEILIQADLDNTGTILVGDSQLSAARFGYALLAGDTRTYTAGVNDTVTTLDKYLMSPAVDAQRVSVELLIVN